MAELLSVLLDSNTINQDSLIKISKARKDTRLADAVYKDIYEEFIDFFIKTKWILIEQSSNEDSKQKASDDAAQQLREAFERFNTPADEKWPKKE